MKWRPEGSNARIFLLTEFPWSLVVAWQTSYLSLYMVACGTTPGAIGTAVGVSGLVQIAGLMAVGFLTDHWGRKSVIMAGDFVGWVVALGLWVLWPVPWALLVGLILQNGSAFVAAPWNSLFSEDAEAERVAHDYFVLQLLTIFGGLLIPLMAPWVASLGVYKTGRTALAMGWPLVVLAWTGRLLWLRESRAGLMQRQRRRDRQHRARRVRLREGLAGQHGRLALLRLMTQVPLTLWATFAPLALVAGGGAALMPAALSYLPLAGAVGGLVLWFTRRWWPSLSSRAGLGAALVAIAAGMGMLALAPRHGVLTVAVGWALTVAGQSWFWTVHTPLWLRHLPDDGRVEVQGWTGAATALVVAAASPAIGHVVMRAPRLVLGLLAVVAGLSVGVWAGVRADPAETLPPTADPV
jgi:MFS family permease